MQLPVPVQRAIEERAASVGFPALKRAAAAMSEAYRDARAGALSKIPAEERLAAYLVTRMPATYAAAWQALRELSARMDGQPASILDIGAGTGAASLAAREFFPGAELTLMERDAALMDASRDWLPGARRISADATQAPLPPADLVIAAYSLGEMPSLPTARLWGAARGALVVVEPGTPRGFAVVRCVRDELLAEGGHLAAPCPAEGPCPITGDDWCHFAARIERSSLHRRVKGGELGHEDEKFSYVAVVRGNARRCAVRIVRHPHHAPGVITIAACTPEGLKEQRVTKRDREAFRAARKARWGEEMLPNSRADAPDRSCR